jgi:hypothetical protein
VPPPIPREARRRKPLLDEAQILIWADAHFAREGKWPTVESGIIFDAPREKWCNVDACLRQGLRGLSGGTSLAQLLARQRGARNHRALPPLRADEILRWADAHFARTGKWPSAEAGPIADAPGETWTAVQAAFVNGLRGLPGGSSLAQFLAEHRETRHPARVPRLSEPQILRWADAHHERTGAWPTSHSGAIPDAPGENWGAVHVALQRGLRGLPGGSSLAQLLARSRGVRNRMALPPLTEEQILSWARRHRDRTGEWPRRGSGAVADAPEETWRAIYAALRNGNRGLPGGVTLPRFLSGQRRDRA